MTSPAVRFKGVPGSPYTRKMLAYLRFRRIPYELLVGDQDALEGLPKPKVELLPTFYLPNSAGDLEAVVDSTPLIRRFEAEYDGRATIPNNSALAFINYLVEDYADEWLTKAMFHYRWHYQADIDMAGTILPQWTGLRSSAEHLAARSDYIAKRQISRLYVVGSNDITAPVIEDSYRRFLSIMDKIIERRGFVFGARPSSADFAIYAQLTQLAKFDPTPAKICLDQAPRVHGWTDVVDDLSGNPALDGDWIDLVDAKSALNELLAEIGHVYAPALIANAQAMAKGDENFSTSIDGRPWTQPTFPYQAKCLVAINHLYQQLASDARAQVDDILQGTGCEALLQMN